MRLNDLHSDQSVLSLKAVFHLTRLLGGGTKLYWFVIFKGFVVKILTFLFTFY